MSSFSDGPIKTGGLSMFHILVARFILEANENIPKKCDLKDVSLHFGQDCIAHLQLGDVFNRPDVTLVPTLDANAGSNGVMKRTAFEYIESTILQTVREHLSELDAIYLHLHGASEVEDIGSGDHHILKEVRRIVGPYLPIAVVCVVITELSVRLVELIFFQRLLRYQYFFCYRLSLSSFSEKR